MNEPILGIDLGTSYSSAAVFIQDKLLFAQDARGEPCVPSAVYFPRRGLPLVGHEAQKMRAQDPASCIISVKRLLGIAPNSDSMRLVEATSAYKIRKRNSDRVAIVTHEVERDPTEVASVIFGHLKKLIEAKLGKRVNRTVLTLPVGATKRQEEDTRRAAKIAGLDVEETLAEPVAGAIAFGLDRFRGSRTLMVFDFGGGTLDVCVLRQHDDNFEVLATGGDLLLGGDNLDEAFAGMMINHVWRTFGVDLHHDVIARDRIQRQCEISKRALSSLESTVFRVRDAFHHGRGPVDLELTVDRRELEARWEELVARAIKTSAETLLSARLRPTDLQQIVLVGGTTFVPMVRRQLAYTFQRPCSEGQDPQTAVATGAALYGARKLRLLEKPLAS